MAKLSEDPKVIALIDKAVVKAVKEERKAVQEKIRSEITARKEIGDKAGASVLRDLGRALKV